MEYCDHTMWVLVIFLAFVAKTMPENVPGIDVAIRDDNREVYCPMHCFCDMEYAHCGNGGFTTFPVNLDMQVKHIMLENNRIRRLRKEDLDYYKTAESITLYGNQIERIEPGAFSGLKNLRKLNLGRNRLQRIDDRTFAGLENLEILNIENNDLDSLSSGLHPLTRLRVIRAGSNKITALRYENFKHSSGIHRLNVSFNEISHMDRDVLKPMQFLRYLILNNNPLGEQASNLNLENNRWIYFVELTNTQMTTMIKNLPPTVSDVRLQNNQIERLNRDDFKNATYLDMLILNDNQLREIEPGALDHLGHLRELWINRNRLQRFPPLPNNIRAVHLDNNDIRSIQTWDLENSPNLEFIYLQKNNIRRIASKSFKDMPYLRSLILRENQLDKLESFTFVNLTNLDFVDLSMNPIREVDRSSFSKLDNLRRLQISRVEQPTEARDLDMLQRMGNLQILDLSLSPGLANSFAQSDVSLPEVKDLNLMYSDLITLPRSFPRRLPKIEIVKIAGNKYHCNQSLTWLPAWLRRKPSMFFGRHLITCNTPLALKNRPIFSIPMAEFRKVRGPPDYDEWKRLPTCKNCPCDRNGVPIQPYPTQTRPTRGPDFPSGQVGPHGAVIESGVKDHKKDPESGSRVEEEKPMTTKSPWSQVNPDIGQPIKDKDEPVAPTTTKLPIVDVRPDVNRPKQVTTPRPVTVATTPMEEVRPEEWPDKVDDGSSGEDFTDDRRDGKDDLGLDYEETTKAPTTTEMLTTTTTDAPTTTTTTESPTTTTTMKTTTETTTTTSTTTTTTPEPTTTTPMPTTTTTMPTTTTTMPTTTTSMPTTTTTMPTTTFLTTTTTSMPTTTTEPYSQISILDGGSKVDKEVIDTILVRMGRSLAAFRTGLWRVYVFGTKGNCSSLPLDRVNATERRIIEVMSGEANITPDIMRRILVKVFKVRKQVGEDHVGLEMMEHIFSEIAKRLGITRRELIEQLLTVFTRTMNCGTAKHVGETPEYLIIDMSRRIGISPDVLQSIIWRLFTTGLDYIMEEPEETRLVYMQQVYPSVKYMVLALAFRSGVPSKDFRMRLIHFAQERKFAEDPYCVLKDFATELDIPTKQLSHVLREIFFIGMDPATVLGTSQYLHGSPLMHYTIYGMAKELGIPLETLRHQLWQMFHTLICNTDKVRYRDSYDLLNGLGQRLNLKQDDILNLLRATFRTGVHNVYMEQTNMTLINRYMKPLYLYTIQGMSENMDMDIRAMRKILWNSVIAVSDTTVEDLAAQFDIPAGLFLPILKWMFREEVRPSMEGKNLPTVKRLAEELYIPERLYINYITELFQGVSEEYDIGRIRTKVGELAKELYIPEIDLHFILRILYKLGDSETIARAAAFHYITMPMLNITYQETKGVLRTLMYILYHDFSKIEDYIINGHTTTTTTVEPPPEEPPIGPKWNLTLLQEMAAELQIPEVMLKNMLKNLLRKLVSVPDRDAHRSFLSSIASDLYIPTEILTATLKKLYMTVPRMNNQYMTGYIQQNLQNLGLSGFNTSISLRRLQRALRIRDQPSFGIDIMRLVHESSHLKRSLLEPAITKLLHVINTAEADKNQTKTIIRTISKEFGIPFTTFRKALRDVLSFYQFPSIENTTDYIYANFINLTIGSLETKEALSKVAEALIDLEKKREVVKVEESKPSKPGSDTGKTLEGRPQPEVAKQVVFNIRNKQFRYLLKDLNLLFGQRTLPTTAERNLDLVFRSELRDDISITTVYVNGKKVVLDDSKLKRLLAVFETSTDPTADNQMTPTLLRQIIKAAYSLKVPEDDTGETVFGRDDTDTRPDAYVRINKQDYLLPEDFIERIYDSFTLPENAIRALNLKFKTIAGNPFDGTGQTSVYVNDKPVNVTPEELRQILDVYGFNTKPMFVRLSTDLVMKLYEAAVGTGSSSTSGTQWKGHNATISINGRQYPLNPEQIYNIFGTRYIPESSKKNLYLRFNPTGSMVYVNGREAELSDSDKKLLKQLFGMDRNYDPTAAREQLPTRLLQKLFEAAVRTHPIVTAQPSQAGYVIFFINGRQYELSRENVTALFGAQGVPTADQRVLEMNFLPLSRDPVGSEIRVLINGNEITLPQDQLQEIKRVVMAGTGDQMTPRLLRKLIRYAFGLDESSQGSTSNEGRDTSNYVTIRGQRYALPYDVVQRIFGSRLIPASAPTMLELRFKTRGGSFQDGTGTTTVTVNGKWVNLSPSALNQIRDVYGYSRNPQYTKFSNGLVAKLYEVAMSPEQYGNFIIINRQRYQLTTTEVREIFGSDSIPQYARKGLDLKFARDDTDPTGKMEVLANDRLTSLSEVDIMLLKALYKSGPGTDPESPSDIPPTYILQKLFQAISSTVSATTREPLITFLINSKTFEIMQSEATKLFGTRGIPTEEERQLQVGVRDEAGTFVVYINGKKGDFTPLERIQVSQAFGLDGSGVGTQDLPKPLLFTLIRVAFSLAQDIQEGDQTTKDTEEVGTASRYIFIRNRRYRIPAGTIQRIFGKSMIPPDVNRTLNIQFKTTDGSFSDGTGQTTVTVNDNPIQLSSQELSQIRDSFFFSTNPLPPELVVQLFETAFGKKQPVPEKPKAPKPFVVINGVVYELTTTEAQTLFGAGDLPALAYRSLKLSFQDGAGPFGPSDVYVNDTKTGISGADVMILNALHGETAQPSADKPPMYLLQALFSALAQVPQPTTQPTPEREIFFWVNAKEYWLPEGVTMQIFGDRSIPTENERYLEVTFRADGVDKNAVFVNGNRGVMTPDNMNKLRAILGLDHHGSPSPIMTRPILVDLVKIAFGLKAPSTGDGSSTSDGTKPDTGSTTFTREDGPGDNYVTIKGQRYLLGTPTVQRLFRSPTIPQRVRRTLELRFRTDSSTRITSVTVNNKPVQLTADELQQARDVYGFTSSPRYTQFTLQLVIKLFEAGIADALGPDQPDQPTGVGLRSINLRGREYLIPVATIQSVFGRATIPSTVRTSLELSFKTVGGSFSAATGQTTVKVNDRLINLSAFELEQIRDVYGYSRTPQHTMFSPELVVKIFEVAYSRNDGGDVSKQQPVFEGVIINRQRLALTPQERNELFGTNSLLPLSSRTLTLMFEKPDSGFGMSAVFVNGTATDITGADVLILEALYGRETTQSADDVLAQEKPPMYLLKMLFSSVRQTVQPTPPTATAAEQVIFWVADKEYGLPKSVTQRMFGSRGIPSTGERYLEAFFSDGRDGQITVNGNKGDLEPEERNRLRAILGLDHHQIDGSQGAVMTDNLLKKIVQIAFSIQGGSSTGTDGTSGTGTGDRSPTQLNNNIQIQGKTYTLSPEAVNRFYGQSTLPNSAPRTLKMDFTTIRGSFELGTGRTYATVNRLNIHLTKAELNEIRDVWGYTTNPKYTELSPQLVEKIYEVVSFVEKPLAGDDAGSISKEPLSLGGDGAKTFTKEGKGDGDTANGEDSISGEKSQTDSQTGDDSITGDDSMSGKDRASQGTRATDGSDPDGRDTSDSGNQGTDGTNGGQESKATGQQPDGSDSTGQTTGESNQGGQTRQGEYITIHGHQYRLPNSTIQKLFGSSTLPKAANRVIELRFKTTGGSFYEGTGQTTVTVNNKPIQLTANELQQTRDVFGFSKNPQYDRLQVELVSKIFETATLDVISGVEATVTNENMTKGRNDRYVSIHGKRYLLPVDTVRRIYGQSSLPDTAVQNLDLDFKTEGGSFYQGTGTTSVMVNGKPVALNSHELNIIRHAYGFTATPEFESLSPELVVKLYEAALAGVNVNPKKGKTDDDTSVAAAFTLNGHQYSISRSDFDLIFGDQGLPPGSSMSLTFIVKYEGSPRDDLIRKTVYVNSKKVDFTETELEDFMTSYKQDGVLVDGKMPIHLIRKVIAAAYDRQIAPGTDMMQRSFLINGRSYELTLQVITSIFGVQGIPAGTDQSIQISFQGSNKVVINGYQAQLSDEEYQELRGSSLRNYDLPQQLVQKIIQIAYGFYNGDNGVFPFQINGRSYNISRQQLRSIYGSDALPTRRVLHITWKTEQNKPVTTIFINGDRAEIPSQYFQALTDSSNKDMPTDLLHLILKKAFVLWRSKSTGSSTTQRSKQAVSFTVNGRPYSLSAVELSGLFSNGRIPAGDARVITVLIRSKALMKDDILETVYKGEIAGTVIDLIETDVQKLRGREEISRDLLMKIIRAAYKLSSTTGGTVDRTATSGSTTGGTVDRTATSGKDSGSTVFSSETRDSGAAMIYVNGRSYILTPDEVETVFGIAGLPDAQRRRFLISYKTSSRWSNGQLSSETSVLISGKKIAFTNAEIDMLRISTSDLPRPLLMKLLRGAFTEIDDSISEANPQGNSEQTDTGTGSTGAGTGSTGSGSSNGTGSTDRESGKTSTGTGSTGSGSSNGTGSTDRETGKTSTGTGSTGSGSSTGMSSTDSETGKTSTGTGLTGSGSSTGISSTDRESGKTSTGTGSTGSGSSIATGSTDSETGKTSTGTGSTGSGSSTGISSTDRESGKTSTGTGSTGSGSSIATGSTDRETGKTGTGTGSTGSGSSTGIGATDRETGKTSTGIGSTGSGSSNGTGSTDRESDKTSTGTGSTGSGSSNSTGSTDRETGKTSTGTGSTGSGSSTGMSSTDSETGKTSTGTGLTGSGSSTGISSTDRESGKTSTGTGSTGSGSSIATGSTDSETGKTSTGTGSTGSGSSTGISSTDRESGKTSTGTGSTGSRSSIATGSTDRETGKTGTGTGSTGSGSSTGIGATDRETGKTSTGIGSTGSGSSNGTGSTDRETGKTGTGTGSTGSGSSNGTGSDRETGKTGTGTGSTGSGSSTGTGSTDRETGKTSTGTGSTGSGSSTGIGATDRETGETGTGIGSSNTSTGSSSSAGTDSVHKLSPSSGSNSGGSSSGSTVFTSETGETDSPIFTLSGRPYTLDAGEVESIFGVAGPPEVNQRMLSINFKTTTSQVGDTFTTETTPYINGKKLTLTSVQILLLRNSGRADITRSLLHILLKTAFGQTDDETDQNSSFEVESNILPSFYINGRHYALTPDEVKSVFGDVSMPEISEREILTSFRASSMQKDDGELTTITEVYANNKEVTLTDVQIQQVRESQAQELPRATLYVLLKAAFVPETPVEQDTVPTVVPIETTTTRTEIISINGRHYGLQPHEVKSIFGVAGLPAYRRRFLRLTFKKTSSQIDGVFNNRTILFVNGIKANLSNSQIEQIEVSVSAGEDISRGLLHTLLQTAFVEIKGTAGLVIQINGRKYHLTQDEVDKLFGLASVPPSGQALRLSYRTSSVQSDTGSITETTLFINGKKANLTDDQLQEVRDSRIQDLSRDLLFVLLRTAYALRVEGKRTSGSTVYTSETRDKVKRNFNINGRQYELTQNEAETIFGITGLATLQQRTLRFSNRTSYTKTDAGFYRTKVTFYVNGNELILTETQIQQIRDSGSRDIPRTLLLLILRTVFVQGESRPGHSDTSSSDSSSKLDAQFVGFYINGKNFELSQTEVEQIFGTDGVPADRTLQLTFMASPLGITSVSVNGKVVHLDLVQVQEIQSSNSQIISRPALYAILRTAYVQQTTEPTTRQPVMTRFYIIGHPYDLTQQDVASIFGDSPLPEREDRTIAVSFRRSTVHDNGAYRTVTTVYVNGRRAILTEDQLSEIRTAGKKHISPSLLKIVLNSAFNGKGYTHEVSDIPTPEVPVPDKPAPEVPDIPAPEVPHIPSPETPSLSKPSTTTTFSIGGRSYDLTSQEISSIFGDASIPPASDRSIRVTFRTSTSKVGDSYITATSVYANGKKVDLTEQEVEQMRKAASQDVSMRLLRMIIRIAFDLPVTRDEAPNVPTTSAGVGGTVAAPVGTTRFYIGGRHYDLTAQEVSSIFSTSALPQRRDSTIALSFRMSTSATGGLNTTVFINGKQAVLTHEQVQELQAARGQDISQSLLMIVLRVAFVKTPKLMPTRTNVFNVNTRPYDLTEKEVTMLFGDAELPPVEKRQVAVTFSSKSSLSWTGWKTVTTVYINGDVIELSDDEITAMKASAVNDISHDLLMKVLRAAFLQGISSFERLTAPPIAVVYNINGQDYDLSLADYRRIFGRDKSPPEDVQNIMMTFRTEVEILGDGRGVVNNAYLNDKKGDFTEQQVQELKEAVQNQKKIGEDLVLLIIKYAFGDVQSGQKKATRQLSHGNVFFNMNGKQVSFTNAEIQSIFGTNGIPPIEQRLIQMSFRTRAVQILGEWSTQTTVRINGQQAHLTPDEANVLQTANTRDSYDTIPRDLLYKILRLTFLRAATGKQTTPSMINFKKTKGTEAAIKIESQEISVSHDELRQVLGAAYSPASRSSMEVKFGDPTTSAGGEIPDVTVFVNGRKIYLTAEETAEIADYYSRDETKMYNERLPGARPMSGRTLSPQLIQKIIDATRDGQSAENAGGGRPIEEGANVDVVATSQEKPLSLLDHIRRREPENEPTMKSTTQKPKKMRPAPPVDYSASDYPEDEPRRQDGDKHASKDEQLSKDEEVWKIMYKMFKF